MRASRITLTVLLLAASWAACPLREAAGDEPQVTLEHLQDMTARWRASFVNLRVVYELRRLPALNKPLVDWAPPADPESAPRASQTEWIWADHGLDLRDNRSFYWTPGSTGVRTFEVYNGPQNLVFRANYRRPPEEVEKLTELEIQRPTAGKPTSFAQRAPMHGLYWPTTAEWLSEKLAAKDWKLDWKLEGVEPVLGHRCAKFTQASSTMTEQLWLDLQHSGLPRRHYLTAVLTSGSRSGVDFVVDKMQRLDGGLWFPERARIQLQAGTDCEENQLVLVTEAEVNVPLDLQRFEPPQPEIGTAVADMRTGQTYIHGQQAAQQGMTSQPTTPRRDVGPLSAASRSSNRTLWILGLIGASAALLAAGLRLRRNVPGS